MGLAWVGRQRSFLFREGNYFCLSPFFTALSSLVSWDLFCCEQRSLALLLTIAPSRFAKFRSRTLPNRSPRNFTTPPHVPHVTSNGMGVQPACWHSAVFSRLPSLGGEWVATCVSEWALIRRFFSKLPFFFLTARLGNIGGAVLYLLRCEL